MKLKFKAYYILIGFFFFNFFIYSQDQKVADSLSVIYVDGNLVGVDKLELLRNLAFHELNDLELCLKYAQELIDLSSNDRNYLYLHRGYLQKGYVHHKLGNIETALESFIKSFDAAAKAEYPLGQGSATMAIASTYNAMGNYSNADDYYAKAITLMRASNDSIALASALLNAGDAFYNNEKYDLALQYFKESGQIFENIKYPIGTAYNYGNVGMVYAKLGKNELAKSNINEAIKILEDYKDYSPISIYLTCMSDIYTAQDDYDMAFEYANRSLELAQTYNLKDQISEANLKLSELNDSIGNKSMAYTYYRNYIVYRDSVQNIETVQKMADLRTDYEVSQKQILLDQQKKTQRIIIYAASITLFLIGLLALGLFKRNKFIRATNKIIAAEKERSDNLLLNILPQETAQELKDKGRVEAKRFESVTVLFTDFKGFTNYAEHLTPEELVNTVDFYFSKFDEIMERYGLEKIKTVGDAYMCAGGLPFPTEDHAFKMILAAMEITEFVSEVKTNKENKIAQFDIRVGINTGPVVAGVVGSKKFAYDIWGDTVNVASRMESASVPGKINISEDTYSLIKNKLNCSFRGEIEVKNRGFLKMYFVENIIAG